MLHFPGQTDVSDSLDSRTKGIDNIRAEHTSTNFGEIRENGRCEDGNQELVATCYCSYGNIVLMLSPYV